MKSFIKLCMLGCLTLTVHSKPESLKEVATEVESLEDINDGQASFGLMGADEGS